MRGAPSPACCRPAALGDAEFERLHAEGAALREADIEAIAFATDDAA